MPDALLDDAEIGRPAPPWVLLLTIVTLTSSCSPERALVRGAVGLPSAEPQTQTVVPSEARLGGIRHAYQTWNNCAAATLSMCLSFYGIQVDQESIRIRMKPDYYDPHVSPRQMAETSSAYGLPLELRAGGSRHVLMALVSAGFPVIVPTWHVERGEEMGHYRLVVGYTRERVRLEDSLVGSGVEYAWRRFDEEWRVMNRQFLVPIRDDHQLLRLEAILPASLRTWESSIESAAHDAACESSRRNDAWEVYPDPRTGRAYAYFNLGSIALLQGRPQDAAAYYDTAFEIGLPRRMLWYQPDPLEAWYRTAQYDKVIQRGRRSLVSYPYSEELLFWVGAAYARVGDTARSSTYLSQAARLHAESESLQRRIQ